MVSETKIDDRCPIGSFIFDGFSPPCRLDRDSKDDGIILYNFFTFYTLSNLLATDKEPIESLYG